MEERLTDYRTVPTVCPYCGTGCGMLLEVSGENVVGVLPQKGHPVSDGALCVKGWTSHEFISSPRRLTSAHVRRDGDFVPTALDEAIALTADALKKALAEDGPESTAFISSAKCTNEENYLVNKLARVVASTNNVDHCARL
jgi:predicted molibdopterin-dependent oxidoreductase YjgC